jgi:hypothetical protein
MAGFRAVLATAGYNAPFVDLQSATPETLARYSAAIFPSRGYLDEESYEKLTAYAMDGGELVTFPEPVTRSGAGARLDSSLLWPHAGAGAVAGACDSSAT